MVETLGTLLDLCWDRLAAGEKPQSLRWPALATTGLGGAAEARMVVLRGVDRSSHRLTVHSDRAAAKVSELSATPLATLLFWDPETSLQIRARIRAEITTGEEAPHLWNDIPENDRDAYGGEPPPGAPLSNPADHAIRPRAERFARIDCTVRSLDLLHLERGDHRRALFEAEDGFTGRWLAP